MTYAAVMADARATTALAEDRSPRNEGRLADSQLWEQSLATPLRRATLGIAGIGTYQPEWALDNAWFDGMLSRKFVQHSGIESRRISTLDEVSMAVRAVDDLRRQTDCDLRECRGVVLACSSQVQRGIARRMLGEERARAESLSGLARAIVARLGIPAVRARAINWGCCGYTKALEILDRYAGAPGRVRPDEFLLAITLNRTSRITDFACKASGPIFGDFAQATLIASVDSLRYPVEFALLYAAAERRPADRVLFNYHLRENVVVPTPDGGRRIEPQRLVFSLDMMGLGEAAPRAMADAAAQALCATGLHPAEVDWVVPHQAGSGVVRLAAMKLEELGIRAAVINGLTREVGNISSSSVPFALRHDRNRLRGTILCPTPAVGEPGTANLSQGCLVLRKA